jgi:predicted RNA binding protein YcfA (HicA-like mRNA interferase family)
MAEYEKEVRRILTQNGAEFVRRGKGDHDIWFSPLSGKNLPVDGKIKSRHVANEIMKQAGILYRFR